MTLVLIVLVLAPIGWCKLYTRSLKKSREFREFRKNRQNGAAAVMGKAMMEGAKAGCLAMLVADTGWHHAE